LPILSTDSFPDLGLLDIVGEKLLLIAVKALWDYENLRNPFEHAMNIFQIRRRLEFTRFIHTY
jgi:hypothetical protein